MRQALGVAGIVVGVVLLAALGAGVWYLAQRRAIDSWGNVAYGPLKDEYVLVEKGVSVRSLGRQLYEVGAIDDVERLYRLVRWLEPGLSKLKTGEYLIKTRSTPRAILKMIVAGETYQHRVTVPEGSTLKEIAAALEKHNLVKAEAFVATAHDREFIRSLGVDAESLEGYLAADTYLFARGDSGQKIAAAMKQQLDRVLTPAWRKRAAEIGMSIHQVLTLASTVEKETGAADERSLIAGVFHNRLKQDMKLQTDPTVIYGLPSYRGDIHKADLAYDHPWNTYLHKGLPPTPIASPGAAAIKAALWPAKTDALFFVSRNDGSHVFCPDYQCHEAAVQQWQVEYFGKRPASAP